MKTDYQILKEVHMVLNHRTSIPFGMCHIAYELYHEGRLTLDEYERFGDYYHDTIADQQDFFYTPYNTKTRMYIGTYGWKVKEIKPRVEWLEKEMLKLS